MLSTASSAWDGSLSTIWQGSGVGSSLTYDLGQQQDVASIAIAWKISKDKLTTFSVQVSADGQTWTKVAQGLRSDKASSGFMTYPITAKGRYIRIVNETKVAIAIAEFKVQLKSVTTLPEPTPVLPPARQQYFVDCTAGSDSANGLSATAAFRTLSKVNSLSLLPGDHVAFKKGCIFTGTLKAASNGTESAPIVYTAYGEGTLPTIHLPLDGEAVLASGSYVILDQLKVTTSRPQAASTGGRCLDTPVAWRVGFEVLGHHVTVQNSTASGFMAGVHLTGSNNRVLRNTLTGNNIMKKNTAGIYDDDSGAWGVLINSDHNEVAHNTLHGNWACSEDYKVDGASVELYEASFNNVHHNLSTEDITFTELGGTTENQSEFNTFTANTYAPVNSGGAFIVLRGERSKWGGNPGTVFSGNIGYMVDLGIICSDGCSPSILKAYDNILWQRDVSSGIAHNMTAMWGDAPFTEYNNVFWKNDGRPTVSIDGGALHASDLIADPLFADATALNFTSPLKPAVLAMRSRR